MDKGENGKHRGRKKEEEEEETEHYLHTAPYLGITQHTPDIIYPVTLSLQYCMSDIHDT